MGSSRYFWAGLVIIIALLNIFVLITGRAYYYKALVYNYVNIDDLDLFPVNTIESGTPDPWNISVSYNQTELPDTLLYTLEHYRSVAFLVIRQDSIVHERYWDDYGMASHSNSFSMAKSFVSTLTGIAIDNGFIESVDTKVCDILPDFCSSGKEKITIKHLLTMSSGLDWDEGYTSLFGPVTRSYYDKDLPGQMYEIGVQMDPGVEWNYMSCNTQLLAMIIQQTTGMSVSEFAGRYLWQPIGAEHDAKWSLDENDGIEKAYCCIYSNARDFARLGKLYMNGGLWGDVRVVSEQYVRNAITPAELDYHRRPFVKYGYQWWITESNGYKVYYARGILGQYVFVIPSIEMVIVRLGHERAEPVEGTELPDVRLYLDKGISTFGNPLE
jgi:CubicO group peptidase (beta-lactamase class C family)